MEWTEKQLQTLYLREDGDGKRIVQRTLLLGLEEKRKTAFEEKVRSLKRDWKVENLKEVESRLDFKLVEFPELVWENILEKVVDYKEKEQLSGMAKIWRDLQESERKYFLFPKVLLSLCNQQYVKKKDLLNLRLVCQNWKETVDGLLRILYQNVPNTRTACIYSGESFPALQKPKGDLLLYFHRIVDKHFDQGIRNNAIFSRDFHISSSHLPVEVDPIAENFIVAWGRELSSFSFSLPLGKELRDPYIECMAEVIRWVPNVKRLGIKGKHVHGMHFMGRFLTDELMLEKLYEMEEGLPRLSQIETIELETMPMILSCASLHAYQGTLKRIIIRNNSAGDAMEVLLLCRFPKLELLVIETESCYWMPPLELLPDLKESFQCLKELVLNYKAKLTAELVTEIVKNANIIGSNILHLTLVLGHAIDQEKMIKLAKKDMPALWLQMPKLETLSLTLNGISVKNIDFILPLRSLKEFKLTFFKIDCLWLKKQTGKKDQKNIEASSKNSSGKNSEENELINYSGYAKRMYESNIWRLFPDLRKLEFIVNKMEFETQDMFLQYKYSGRNNDTAKSITLRKKYTRDGFNKYLEEQYSSVNRSTAAFSKMNLKE